MKSRDGLILKINTIHIKDCGKSVVKGLFKIYYVKKSKNLLRYTVDPYNRVTITIIN